MARLVRTDPEIDPGFKRVGAGRGFQYLNDADESVSKAAKARIKALAIPPAWIDVWIAADPVAHIQAVGIDTAGRKQYIYHQRSILHATVVAVLRPCGGGTRKFQDL